MNASASVQPSTRQVAHHRRRRQARAIAVIARNDIDTSAVVQGGGVVVAGVFVQASHTREVFAAPVVGVGLRVVVARRQGGAAREHTRPVDGGFRIVVVCTFFSATHAAREVAEGRDGGFWIVVARALQDAPSAGVEVATSVVEVRQRVVVAGLGVCTIKHQAAEVLTRPVVRVGVFLIVARVDVCATQDHEFHTNHVSGVGAIQVRVGRGVDAGAIAVVPDFWEHTRRDVQRRCIVVATHRVEAA